MSRDVGVCNLWGWSRAERAFLSVDSVACSLRLTLFSSEKAYHSWGEVPVAPGHTVAYAMLSGPSGAEAEG